MLSLVCRGSRSFSKECFKKTWNRVWIACQLIDQVSSGMRKKRSMKWLKGARGEEKYFPHGAWVLHTFTFGCTWTRPSFFSYLSRGKSGVTLLLFTGTVLPPNQSLLAFLTFSSAEAILARHFATAQLGLWLLILQLLATGELTLILALLPRLHHCSDVGITACRLHFSWPCWW